MQPEPETTPRSRWRLGLSIVAVLALIASACQFNPAPLGLDNPAGHCGGITGTHGFSGGGGEHFTGGGDDVIVITSGPVTVNAGPGNDLICVLGLGDPAAPVIVRGGNDNDTIYGNVNTVCVAERAFGCTMPASRNPVEWPFAWNSIWNTPIGSGANYVPAGIAPSPVFGVFADEDILILEPTAPQVDVVAHDADWNPSRPRCTSIVSPTTVLMSGLPVPNGFSTEPTPAGDTPNNSGAILMPDGRTIRQTQPLHRCGTNGPMVSQYNFPDDDIRTGTGIPGAHGGSAMSSLGGTIRVGELVPGGEIHHALKVVLDSSQYLFYSSTDGTPGFRWPASVADFGAETDYGGTRPALQMGSLLALDPNFAIERLRTEPAKILARAMMNYGGYVVDSSGWNTNYFATEFGPDGRVIDEFASDWGFPFITPTTSNCTNTANPSCRWSKDIADIFSSMVVVTNNGPNTIGGPGTRRRPCAPAFIGGGGAAPATCTLG